VLAEGGHRSHDRFLAGRLDGRQQRVDVSAWGADPAPPTAGVQLRVAGELLGRAEPGIGDSSRLERLADLVSAAAREGVLDDRGQLAVVRHPVRVAREARVRRQVSPPQDVAAEY
jgi:hypothetical protein